MSWSHRALGALCLKIGSGITPRGGDSVYQADGVSLIRSQNVYNSRFQYEGLAHISDDQADAMSGVEVTQDDILLNITGDSVARCCRVPKEVLPARVNQHVAIIRPDRAILDTDFLCYFFTSPFMQSTMLSLAGSGGTRKALTKAMIEKFAVPVPEMSVQKEISKRLRAYDDFIVNNRRRMELLEQSARLLFKEWFVQLRYPGHEHDKITDGVPAGWRKERLRDLCESVDYGYTASAEKDNVGPHLLRITDIVGQNINWDDVPYCLIDERKKKKYELQEGDIVVARTGATVGYAKRVNKHRPDSVFASYLVRLRPKSKALGAMMSVFVESDDYKRYVMANVGGAAQPNANAQVLSNAILRVPKESVGQSFAEMVEPIFSQSEILAAQIRGLVKARDLFLPRLMDGRISI
jgi:type I restriction enzyme S subunit